MVSSLVSHSELRSSRRADLGLEYKLKQDTEVGISSWKQSIKSYVTILYSVWSMFDCPRYISPTLPLSFSENGKFGNPKEEIGNL